MSLALSRYGRRLRGVAGAFIAIATFGYLVRNMHLRAPISVTNAARSLNQWSTLSSITQSAGGDSYYGPDDGSVHQEELVGRDGAIAQTKLLVHAAGNSIFERLYVYRGTLYVVTDDPDDIPDIKFITSNGEELQTTPRPTSRDISVISPSEARNLFSSSPITLPGTSFMITENPQFAAHYYHFGAEIFISLWRTYMSLDPLAPASGKTVLAPPSRIIYSHANSTEWRDRAHMVPFMIRAMFGPTEMMFGEDWRAMGSIDYTFVFDRAVIFDRYAAQNGPHSKKAWKCTAEAFSLGVVENWWEPVRRSVLQFVDRAKGMEFSRDPKRPLVTYISRQSTARRLEDGDHARLVEALTEGQERLGYEFKLVLMENLSKPEQMKLASQTTIMVGVHGNGLTNMLWMERSPKSTVIEIHFPEAFVVDYAVPTKVLGHQYRGFWNDTYFIEKEFPHGMEGMHGPHISIHAPAVISVIAEILRKP